MKNKYIYISSDYAYQFKKIVKPFKELINILKLSFNDSCVIVNSDGIINNIELYSTYFNEYFCNKQINIEIDKNTLKNLFKNIKSRDVIYIEVREDDPCNIYLIVKNKLNNKNVSIKLLINDALLL